MNVSRALVRSFSRSATKNADKKDVAPVYVAVREKYKRFQIDDDLLVHQKKGHIDNAMFVLTVLVNGIGLVMVGDLFYRMSFNKK